MSLTWKGVFPALTTHFKEDLSLDLDLCNSHAKYQLDAGVDGLIVGGSLGETSTMLAHEKEELFHSLKQVSGTAPIIINIAEQATAAAVDQAEKAEAAGADGLMLLPPMRYKADDAETNQYFLDVAKSTSLPIMIYNNPVDYKIEVTLDMFEELAKKENITAVKESTRDTTNITRMINRFGDRFAILGGVDTLAIESLALGASGWVAGLVDAFPAETVAIFRLMKAGRIEEAVAINRWFLPLCELDIHPKLVQNIKLAESMVGIGNEVVRPPRQILSGKERENVVAIIQDALDTRPELPDYLSL